MGFKIDDKVKVVNKSKDYHLAHHEGRGGKVVAVPTGKDYFHYEVEFDNGDFEMCLEEDIEKV